MWQVTRDLTKRPFNYHYISYTFLQITGLYTATSEQNVNMAAV